MNATNAAVKAPEGDNATAQEQAAKPDPFANLKTIKLGETDNVVDMSDLATSDPRKYAKVQEEAKALRSPLQKNWKHATAMFIPGTNKGGENGFKPGSVYGTIADIVNRAGRSGISAHEVVTQLRQRQSGNNKRSHYCTELPPVGWAEGWLNSAVTKNIIGIHATKRAPALFVTPAADAGDGKAAANG